MLVPVSVGSFLWGGTRTSPNMLGDFSNMSTRSATLPLGRSLRGSCWMPEPGVASVLSLMCCFCWAVSSGCGAAGTWASVASEKKAGEDDGQKQIHDNEQYVSECQWGQ